MKQRATDSCSPVSGQTWPRLLVSLKLAANGNCKKNYTSLGFVQHTFSHKIVVKI